MADESSKAKQYMLTTVDNPWDPFTRFQEWYAYDMAAGYHTCGLLDRIALTSNELSELDHAQAIEDAIDEIVQENVLGIFRKVSPDSFRDGVLISEDRGSTFNR